MYEVVIKRYGPISNKELLEVYKAAKGYLKANEDFIYRYTRGIETLPSADKTLMAMHLLRGAIIKLEERHAK